MTIITNKVDFMFLTEMWLGKSISSTTLIQTALNFLDVCRSGKKGGCRHVLKTSQLLNTFLEMFFLCSTINRLQAAKTLSHLWKLCWTTIKYFHKVWHRDTGANIPPTEIPHELLSTQKCHEFSAFFIYKIDSIRKSIIMYMSRNAVLIKDFTSPPLLKKK